METEKKIILNWSLNHHKPNLFVTSQWQTQKYTVSCYYLLYKLSTLVFLLGNFIYLLILDFKTIYHNQEEKFLIYLTNWGLMILLSRFIIETILIYRVYYNQYQQPVLKMSKLHMLSWGLVNLSDNLAILIRLIQLLKCSYKTIPQDTKQKVKL